MSLIEAKGVSKSYADMARPVSVLNGLDFSIKSGDVIGIFGASGSGKSTLLHILGGIDAPDSGDIEFEGRNIYGMTNRELAQFRNRKIGFIFQFYHLLAEFTALENAMMPALISGMKKSDAKEAAKEALEMVGLSGRFEHRPPMLSGGEQQRVALARAVVMRPPLILADEPTGNLDTETGELVMKYLLSLNKKFGMALAVVTHNPEIINRLPRSFELKGGRLHGMRDESNKKT